MNGAKHTLLVGVILLFCSCFIGAMEERENRLDDFSRLIFKAISENDQATISNNRSKINDSSLLLDDQQRTMIQAALDEKFFGLVRFLATGFLLPNQLALTHRDNQDRSALDIAFALKHIPICLLEKAKANKQLIAISIRKFVNLLAKAPTFNKKKDQHILETLIESLKPKTLNDIRDAQDHTSTLLHLAAGSTYDNYQLVDFLLKNSVDPIIIDVNSRTALDIAQQNNNKQTSTVLGKYLQSSEISLHSDLIECDEEISSELLIERLFTALDNDNLLNKYLDLLKRLYPEVSVLNKANQTLLQAALAMGKHAAVSTIMEQLSKNQLALLHRDYNNLTALDIAMSNQYGIVILNQIINMLKTEKYSLFTVMAALTRKVRSLNNRHITSVDITQLRILLDYLEDNQFNILDIIDNSGNSFLSPLLPRIQKKASKSSHHPHTGQRGQPSCALINPDNYNTPNIKQFFHQMIRDKLQLTTTLSEKQS